MQVRGLRLPTRTWAGALASLALGLAVGITVGQSIGVARSETQEPDAATLAAAHDLVLTLGLDRQMSSIVELVARGRQEKDQTGSSRSRFLDALSARLPLIRQETALLYARRFKAPELVALTDFFRAGTGAKFLAASADIQREASRIGLKHAREALLESEKVQN